MNRGIVYAVSAYIFWGIHPIYWKLLQNVPSIEILSHRIVWSFLFFFIVLSLKKEWKKLRIKLQSTKNKLIIFLPALLIGSNWGMYIWAVNAGFIIETSLGYFICPLLSVLLGVVFLKENLRIIQWLAISIAAFGVLIMTLLYGKFPWISLYLAGTWAAYGLLRKKSPLNAVEGLTVESASLLLPMLTYLFFLSYTGHGFFLIDFSTSILLVGTGVTSGLPLLVFISGARKINLSLIGVLQYILPTLLFFVGIFIYDEPLTKSKIIGFIFIWFALIIYTLEGTLYIKSKNNRNRIP